jgi:hypothetical protein
MWEWSKAGALPSDFEEGAEHAWSPVVVHKTRRSLRAVHFHPHGAPLMLTAEVDHCLQPLLEVLECRGRTLSDASMFVELDALPIAACCLLAV